MPTKREKFMKTSIRSDKRKWMDDIAKEGEDAAGNLHMRTLYRLTKTLCNERPRRSVAVLDKDGNLLSKEEIQARWTEHFKEILNREEPANQIFMDEENGFEFANMIEEITTNQPTLGEVKAAIGRLKNGKSPGIDSITAELLKADAGFSVKKIHQLMKKVWEHEKIPTKWKQGLIIKLAKKRNLKECKNSRGITLLSVVSNILGRIIIDRVRNGVDQRLRKEQAGYRRGRGTTDQVLYYET